MRSVGKNCDLKITLLAIQQPDPTLVGVTRYHKGWRLSSLYNTGRFVSTTAPARKFHLVEFRIFSYGTYLILFYYDRSYLQQIRR